MFDALPEMMALLEAAFGDDVASSIDAARRLRMAAAELEVEKVRAAIAAGAGWSTVGGILGVSDREAWELYSGVSGRRRDWAKRGSGLMRRWLPWAHRP